MNPLHVVVGSASVIGGAYYRCFVPYDQLRKNPNYKVTFTNTVNARVLEDCDVLVLSMQYAESIYDVTMKSREQCGFKLVFEFDDHLHALPTTNPNHERLKSGGLAVMERFIRSADICTTTTQALANYYRRWNNEISICHNAIADDEAERLAPAEITGEPKRSGQIRIGYAAAPDGHANDFRSIVRIIAGLMETNPQVRVVVVGADFRRMLPLGLQARCEFAGETNKRSTRLGLWSVPPWMDLIKASDIDVLIAPLERTTFNSGKSYLKVVEAGILGIPIVASGIYEYAVYSKEAPVEPILLARNDKEWRRVLGTLIIDADKRTALARANSAYVKSRHTMSKRIVEWETALSVLRRQA